MIQRVLGVDMATAARMGPKEAALMRHGGGSKKRQRRRETDSAVEKVVKHWTLRMEKRKLRSKWPETLETQHRKRWRGTT